ncbi:MAG: cob(I)yrinic acid a,c-diamide adenosyltransferase [Lachnospiraceae bacterium]|nr:cob(I)yrinic acid a,c-diamide adenosyltransferase [Lachnospiraceae bacterium]
MGLMDYNILDEEDIAELLRVNSTVKLILTGRNCPESIRKKASLLSHIEAK